jgi:hypothetical protein
MDWKQILSAILYGFSVGDPPHAPIWFYNRENAEIYLRFHKLNCLIEREEDVNPIDIGDSENTTWAPDKQIFFWLSSTEGEPEPYRLAASLSVFADGAMERND